MSPTAARQERRTFHDGTVDTVTFLPSTTPGENGQPPQAAVTEKHSIRFASITSPPAMTLTFLVWIQVLYVTMVYGPIAAFLVELFPTRIRYSSMSLPYHIGNGVFGGMVPFIGQLLIVRTGNPLSQQSPHLTFAASDDLHDDFAVQADRYFVQYKEGPLTAWGGRNTTPFWQQNEMWWDEDVTPTGAAASYDWKLPTGTLTGTGFRRRSCCLYYRVPGGGVCGDCCFLRPPRSSPRAASG